MEPISFLCNTKPNLSKLERNLPRILPYVDQAVICIGKRDEPTEGFCGLFPKVKLVYFAWNDSFKDAYQACLDHALREGWHLRLDDDESPSNEMLTSLRKAVEQSERGKNFDVVEYRCNTILDNVDQGPTDYYREVFYRWNPNLHYEVDLHQSLVGLKGPKVRSDLIYDHHKSTLGQLRSLCRDYFIAGVWADHTESFLFWHNLTGQDPRMNTAQPLAPSANGIPFPLKTGFLNDAWYEMRDILHRHHPEVKLYFDLDYLMRSGKVCQEFKVWALNHNEQNDPRPHLSEQHAFYTYLTLLERGS